MNEEEPESDLRFISMLSDYGFKVAFCNENHTRFLRKALQALIASDTAIRTVQFSKNEVIATTKDARGGLYDIVCEDEHGRVFIVEMQLFDYSNMIHRAKFYAFHRFNTMVRKGRYRFNDLRRIYTISILAGNTYRTNLYHQIGTLKNQQGELMDDQITHVVIELDKFQKTLEQIDTDLDKLLYTMKLTSTAPKDTRLPDFMTEGWLEEMLKELDNANLTLDQRAELEMIIAGNMTEKVAMEEREEQLKKEIEARVKKETEERVKKETEERVKKETEETIARMINKGYDPQDISEIMNVSLDTVKAVKERIDNN